MINIREFSGSIGKSVGITTRQADNAIKEIVERITQGVNDGESMNVPGLGFFKKVMRKGRVCRNPMTGELMKWNDVPVVKYHPANRFSKAVKNEK